MKAIRVLFATLVAICAWSCSSNLEEELSYGSISGTVSDKTTGEPVSTVKVTLSPGGMSTVTGSDGSFFFEDLESDVYTLEIRKEGYSPNTGKVSVKEGQNSEAHLLIERITASLTSDKTELDFGETLNTLSFNIVNRWYADLAYKVETGDCNWIFIDPQTDVIKYGKTATIVVKIDRNKLKPGRNEENIIVRSTNGSGNVEIKVIAEGEYRVAAVVKTFEPGINDVESNLAFICGEVIDEGSPKISEKGVIWSAYNDFSIEKNIGRQIVSDYNQYYQYSATLNDLVPDTKYYAKAYVIQSDEAIYGNTVQFTTPKIPSVVETYGLTDLTTSSFTLNGAVMEIGVPEYEERGFCYYIGITSGNISVANNKTKVAGSGKGDYSVTINYYADQSTMLYYRAYVIQKGEVIYGNQKSISIYR